MAYAPPSIGAQGLVVPSYNDILNDLLDQYRQIFGQTVSLTTSDADYQDVSAFSLKVSDTYGAVILAVNARSPRTAVGSGLDAVVSINGIVRKSATYSSCLLTITGNPGTAIVNGVVRDVNGYYWDLPGSLAIPASAVLIASATCESIGAITALPGQVNIISTPTAGWTAVTNNNAAIVGQGVETDAQLRARQAISVSLPSHTLLAGTQAAIAAVANVTRYNVVENSTSVVDANGNPPHSVSCVVEGGDQLAIATAIYNNHGIGCNMNGTTQVTVSDASTNFQTSVGFFLPFYVPIYVVMTVQGLTNYTSAVLLAIQAALVTYLNSLQIGEVVTYSSMYVIASQVMPSIITPQFSIRSVAIGTSPNPSGSADIPMAFNQVAQGVAANIVLMAV